MDGVAHQVVGILPPELPPGAARRGVPGHRRGAVGAAPVRLRPRAAAELHVLHRVRAAPAGRDLRAGAGGDGRDRAPVPEGIPGARRHPGADPGRAAAGGRGQARAARRCWCCSARSAWCCSSPAPTWRTCCSCAPPCGEGEFALRTALGREPRGGGPAAADRERACSRWRAARWGWLVTRSRSACSARSTPPTCPRLAEIDLDGAVLGVHRAHLPGDDARLRPGAGAAGGAAATRRRTLQGGGRAGTGGRRHRMRSAPHPGRGGAVGGAAGGRGPAGAELRRAAAGAARVRRERRAHLPARACRRAAIPNADSRRHLRARARAPSGRAAGRAAGRRHLQLPLTGSGPLSPYAFDEATARNWEASRPTAARCRPTTSRR